jgi:hypothetical protein
LPPDLSVGTDPDGNQHTHQDEIEGQDDDQPCRSALSLLHSGNSRRGSPHAPRLLWLAMATSAILGIYT